MSRERSIGGIKRVPLFDKLEERVEPATKNDLQPTSSYKWRLKMANTIDIHSNTLIEQSHHFMLIIIYLEPLSGL